MTKLTSAEERCYSADSNAPWPRQSKPFPPQLQGKTFDTLQETLIKESGFVLFRVVSWIEFFLAIDDPRNHTKYTKPPATRSQLREEKSKCDAASYPLLMLN